MWVRYRRKKALRAGPIGFGRALGRPLKVLFLFQSSHRQFSYHKIWIQRHRIPVKPADFYDLHKELICFYLLFLSFPLSILYFSILFIYSTPRNVCPLFTSDTPFLVPCVLTSFGKLFTYSSVMMESESLEGVFLLCSFLGPWYTVRKVSVAALSTLCSLLKRRPHQAKLSFLSTVGMPSLAIRVGRGNPVAELPWKANWL